MNKKHKPIFSIQEEPPVWSDDSDGVDLESISEPDDQLQRRSSSPVPALTEDTTTTTTAQETEPPEDDHDDVIVEDDLDDDDSWVEPEKSLKVPATKEPMAVHHFPFPSSDDGQDPHPEPRERRTTAVPYLRSPRARNGGRTQSGGVKGIYVDSGSET